MIDWAAVSLLFFVFVSESLGLCPRGCICSNSGSGSGGPEVDCSSAGLKHIPLLLNPRIRSLNLRGNSISTVKLEELSLYAELEFLDLSENKIFLIERGAFYRNSKLKGLKLSGNSLQTLGIDTFVGLAEVGVLDLGGNDLRRIPTSAFSDLRNLEFLNLSSNSIREFAPGAFTGISQLKSLHLAWNQLRSIPKMENLQNLRILNLEKNRIFAIPERIFEFLINLKELRISGNEIEKITDSGFQGLSKLESLDLSWNFLYRIPNMALGFLTDLKFLKMSGNLFLELETANLESLRNLERLEISECPLLKRIAINAFAGLDRLSVLELQKNPSLEFFHPFAFENWAPNLRKLFLSGNNFTNLPESLLQWTQLTVLDLRGNPWDCNCNLRWMSGTLRQIYPLGFPEGIQCESPPSLQNQPLGMLTDGDFECGLEDLDQKLYVFTIGGTLAGGFLLFIFVVFCAWFRGWGCKLFSFCIPKKSTFYSNADHLLIAPSTPSTYGKVTPPNLFYYTMQRGPSPNNHYMVPENQPFLSPNCSFGDRESSGYPTMHPHFNRNSSGYPTMHPNFNRESSGYAEMPQNFNRNSSGYATLPPNFNREYSGPEFLPQRQDSFRIVAHYPVPITEL